MNVSDYIGDRATKNHDLEVHSMAQAIMHGMSPSGAWYNEIHMAMLDSEDLGTVYYRKLVKSDS